MSVMLAEHVETAIPPVEMRTIDRAYRTELDPTKLQIAAFYRHSGAARFMYNWALARKNEVRVQWAEARDAELVRINDADGPVPDAQVEKTRRVRANAHASSLHRIPSGPGGLNQALTVMKRTDEPWLYGICNACLQNAIRNVDSAFQHFFRRLAEGETGREAGEPRFKRRGDGPVPFKFNGAIHVNDGSIQLPVIGIVKLKERGYLPVAGIRLTSATVSERAGRWYVSIQAQEDIPVRIAEGPRAAVHLGVRYLATVRSEDGVEERIANPLPLARLDRKRKRLQRELCRRQKGSANRDKTKIKLARLHARIVDTRRDAMHRATTDITHAAGSIVTEDWGIKDMFQTHRIAERLGDAAMGEFRQALLYKADWQGVPVEIRPRGFPSSRRCAQCGEIQSETAPWSVVYECGVCGWMAERETNATINLLTAPYDESINGQTEP